VEEVGELAGEARLEVPEDERRDQATDAAAVDGEDAKSCAGFFVCQGRDAASVTACATRAEVGSQPMTGARFDVAVVGASIAGCTAARLFGLAGARVALIERRPDVDAYKVVCTHAIQPSATPTIERLGLAPLLEARGAIRAGARMWTPYSGWVELPEDLPRAWGVTRRPLDPTLRKLAADTPGVELMLGHAATGLVGENGTPAGVRTRDAAGLEHEIRARLVVGADGRGSSVAEWARVPGRVRRHGRFFYFAYWRGWKPGTTDMHLWLLDPDGGALFPNEDGLAVLVVARTRPHLPKFRADLEGEYMRGLAEFPDGPDLSEAERVSKIVGKLDMPNVMRPAGRPGIAFVGDAALATDPLWGVGCGFAFQSGEWLVDETSAALLGDGDLGRALERYARVFRRRLGMHHFVIAEYASGRKSFAWERFATRAAANDEVVARRLGEVAGRMRQPLALLDPLLLPRVLRAGGRGGSR
jgi:menaquinone-9 beta-reductase